MRPTLHSLGCWFLVALTTGAAASAQNDPASADASKLAVSNQAKEQSPVDIAITLRHTAPAAAKGTEAAGAAEGQWVVEIETVGRTPAGKPVALPLDKQDEIEKELRAAGSPKAKKVGEATISEATVSIRVPARTPFALVRQMLTTAATVGLHKLEFVVLSPGSPATERSLPLPLPVDGGTKPVLEQPKAGLERIRVNMRMDKATGHLVRKWGSHEGPAGAEGDAEMRESFATIMKDMVKFGLADRSRVLVDAAGDVPWQAVVEVIDIGLNAGCNGVQFWTGAAKK